MQFSKRLINLRENLTEQVLEQARKNPQAISLASGTPPFEIPQKILKLVLAEALENAKLSQYQSLPKGSLMLRKLIALDLSKEFQREVSPEEILITAGSTVGLFLVIQAFVDNRDEILILSPHWSLYTDQCQLTHSRVNEISLDENLGWNINKKILEKNCNPEAKIILFADPNNPTGTVLSTESKQIILESARKNKMIILADEAYCHLMKTGVKFQSILKLANIMDEIVIIRSFSKDFSMSGFRLGFIYTKKEIIDKLVKIHTAIVLAPSTFSQEIAKRMYQVENDISQEYSQKYDILRNLACDRLRRMSQFFSFVEPVGGFFVFPRYHLKTNSISFFKKLLKAGVVIRPGIGFGSGGEQHIRISLTVPEKNLHQAFDRIDNYLKNTGL